MEYNLRQMTVDDISDVISGEERAFGKSLGFDLIYQDLTLNPYAYYFVLEIDGEISGYIGLWITEDNAEIINFYVDEKYRGLGFGSMLLDFSINLVSSSGVGNLSLEVRRSNNVAISLYEKYGFKYSHDRKNYYDNSEDVLVYILDFEVQK